LWLIVCLMALPPGLAAAGSGEDLMRRLDDAQASTGERITVHLTRTTASGSPREAEFVMETLSPTGEPARSKIVFASPGDVAGTAVLSVEEAGIRSQWIYLPEVEMVRKLANPDRTESFVGTDFTLEDLRMRADFVNRSYEVVGTEQVEGQTCTLVEDKASTPKEAKYSGYGKVRLFVEEARLLVWKVEFYDKQGSLLRCSLPTTCGSTETCGASTPPR